MDTWPAATALLNNAFFLEIIKIACSGFLNSARNLLVFRVGDILARGVVVLEGFGGEPGCWFFGHGSVLNVVFRSRVHQGF